MKIIVFVLASLCLSVFNAVAQVPDHPGIESVKVLYKPNRSAAPSQGPSASPEIKVNAIAGITLRSGSDAVKLYLTIKDRSTNAVLYQVDYLVNSADVVGQGMTLYARQGDQLSVTNPTVMTLKPYLYELYTESAEGEKSSVYTIIQ